MNKNEAMVGSLMLKGMLTELSQEDRAKVEQAAEELRDFLDRHGDEGRIALSLVMCEEAAK